MKKIILAIVVSITAMVANSQSSDPLRDKLDSIFNFIDKTQIPTGYLKEYGSEMVPLHPSPWFVAHETFSFLFVHVSKILDRTSFC